jgi:ABC-type long-subunit fatty acid transport system fused permease/ATPase subunit
MNIWNRAIFDALEQGDATPVFFLSMVYFPLLAASVCLVVAQVYARMTTQRRWREWLTHHLLDCWLTNGRYYQLHLVHGAITRIRNAASPPTSGWRPIPRSTLQPVSSRRVLSAATFITVLWTIGGSLSLSLAGVEITIPGFLVVAAVTYAMLASGSMVFIGHRFVTVSESKNQSEAELRYVLTRAERERRKHCRARRGGRGARCSRHVVDHGVAPLARPLLSNDAHDDCLADQQLHPAGSADHPPVERGLHVRAEISRRHDVAGLGLRRPSAFRR